MRAFRTMIPSARSILAATTALALATTAGSAFADDFIKIRLSYKVLLNPADGSRPPGVTDGDIDAAIAEANALLASFGRGYRYVLADPLTDIGGAGGTNRPNPSFYYNMDIGDKPTREDLDADAQSHQAQYAWNPNAINLFLVHGGGACINVCECSAPQNIIVLSTCAAANGKTHIHEMGHYMGLCHTQGCGRNSCSDGDVTPTDDRIDDTLPDVECWDQNAIAQFSYSQNYNNLTAAHKTMVDNVFFDIMSYHHVDIPPDSYHTRFTELQLDKWVDTASWTRTAVRDGITSFVDTNAGPVQSGTSVFPFDTVAKGLNQAHSGKDIVLIRPGSYPENLTINVPVTLRVPRTGNSRIGAP